MEHKEVLEYLDAAIDIETDVLLFTKVRDDLIHKLVEREHHREKFTQFWENQTIKSKPSELQLDDELIKPIKEQQTAGEKIQADLENARVLAHNKRKSGWGSTLLTFVALFILSTLAMFLFGFKERLTSDDTFATVFFIVALALSAVVAVAVKIISGIVLAKKEETLKKQIQDVKKTNAATQERLNAACKEKETRLAQYAQDQQDKYDREIVPQIQTKIKQEEFLQTQINDTQATLNQLLDKRKEFYDVGVIPPDYRYFDCVMVLRQIFTNDLADTMRDAILLYEERVFRGELIRGVDKINEELVKINQQLERLNVMMRFVVTKLTEISYNSSEMVNELETIADKIDENTAVNEMILGGIAIQIAQTEAIKNNTKATAKFTNKMANS